MVKKLRSVLRQYPEFTEEHILEATTAYVKDCQKNNFMFMKTAENFIMKEGASTLATYVENKEEAKKHSRSNVKGTVV